MRCPLCSGPLHIEGVERFVCERGHSMSIEEMRGASAHRVTTALWMAIEALESEAIALRHLSSIGNGGSSDLAEQAEKDAMVLRSVATAHGTLEVGRDGA